MNTFHEQRVKDLKSSHQEFLREQIKFYQKVMRYMYIGTLGSSVPDPYHFDPDPDPAIRSFNRNFKLFSS